MKLGAPLRIIFLLLLVQLLVGCSGGEEPANAQPVTASKPPDLLLLNGYVYTSDAQASVAEAVAVSAGLINAVGSNADLLALQGPDTRVIDLAGRMLLPGLHDAHLHLFGIVEPDVCSLRSQPMSLEEMVPYIQECLQRYELPPGTWLPVDMWNFAEGNQTSNDVPTLRAALDAVSTEHPIILWGNDGHHGAVNSRALEQAIDAQGNVVGLNATTLATNFADFRDLVGVDGAGEPNGELNEQAQGLVSPPPRRDPAILGPLLPAIGAQLARNGITSVQDARLNIEYLPYLKAYEQSGDMRFRIQVATRLDPIDFRDPLTGEIRLDEMLQILEANRTAFRESPLIHATAAKIYVDGVIEGNPYSDPPTLGNGAMLKPYLQPRFHFDPDSGKLTVLGYVDTASALCEETRATSDRFEQPAAVAAFRAEHGFHPAQCVISYGVLRDPEPFINSYVRRLDEHGFTIHIHAVGDRAVRVGVDALAQVIQPGSGNPLRHGMAHLQLVHPDDQQRIGEMGLYLAWSFAWAVIAPDYDLAVLPFIDDVTGPAGIYDPSSYYMQNAYPVRSTMNAGAVAVGGSDAPVDDLSPRPFINMALGVTRQGPFGGFLNAEEAIDIHQMIAAYTINGARALNQEDIAGSIEVGKKADLVVLDRNIVDLYESGNGIGIAETAVDLTLFEGEIIYVKD